MYTYVHTMPCILYYTILQLYINNTNNNNNGVFYGRDNYNNCTACMHARAQIECAADDRPLPDTVICTRTWGDPLPNLSLTTLYTNGKRISCYNEMLMP